jgi:hypothetical protein
MAVAVATLGAPVVTAKRRNDAVAQAARMGAEF